MGGAVSSGESNDDLIDNLLEADYIKSPVVERVFRAVDRAFYYTDHYKQNAYKDLAWKDGNLHLSAPCIYSEVLENLDLQPGMCFLNVGSGTGYFSTMCGLILGRNGVNHGIELYPDVVCYARTKLMEFQQTSPAVDEFDFCPPQFAVGNCLEASPASMRYDRIYCGAAASMEYVTTLVDMLKIGGVCVVPVADSLMRIIRVDRQKDQRSTLLPVSFANLVSPKENAERSVVELPEWSPLTLSELCRAQIRKSMRQTISVPERLSVVDESRKKKRKRRQDRHRTNRLVLLQHHRTSSSDEDRNNGSITPEDNPSPERENDEENSPEESPRVQVETTSETGPENNSQQEESMSGRTGNESVNLSGSSSAAAAGSRNGVVLASGSISVNAVNRPAGSKREASESIAAAASVDSSARRSDRRSDALGFLSRTRTIASASRSGRGVRCRRTAADIFLETFQGIVRGSTQQFNVTVTRQPPARNRSTTDQSSSPSTSGREDNADNVDEGIYGAVDPIDMELSSSSSDSTASLSGSSSSSDDDFGADESSDVAKKRCKSEHGSKSLNSTEPKPDPLLVNPCSVQMRKKIIELPLPPALKVYLNYDRRLYYV